MKHSWVTALRCGVAALALLAAGSASAQQAPRPAFLLVGDPAAGQLYVYSVPELRLLASFNQITVGAHAGIIALPDGRALIPEEQNKQLVVLQLAANAAPTIAARAPMPIPIGSRYGWAAVDPGHTVYMMTSDDDLDPVELVSMVDLSTYAAKQFKVDVQGPPDAEMHITLAGTPPAAIIHKATRVDSFSVSALADRAAGLGSLLGGGLKPNGSIAVGNGGHSNSYSMQTGKWVGSTLRGLEVARLVDGVIGEAKLLPWEANGLSGGRNARQRMTTDGRHVFGTLNAAVPPEKWAEAKVDVHWADLTTDTVTRLPLAPGLVGRGGVSSRHAVYSNIHPDGDFANILDVNPASAQFRQVVARVPLDKLAGGPVADQPAAGRQSRHSTISVDGRWAFVTHGGDGRISVIDTAERRVTSKLSVPTPLNGGGYIVAVELGAPVFELAAR